MLIPSPEAELSLILEASDRTGPGHQASLLCFLSHRECAGVSASLSRTPVASWVMPLSPPRPAPSKSWVLCAFLAWFLCIYLPSEQELGRAGSGCAPWAEHPQWQSQRTGIKNVAERGPLFSSSSLVCLSFLCNPSFPAFLAT